MHVEDVGLDADQRDRLEVPDRIEAGLLVQADVGREDAAVAEQQRVAVGRGPRDVFAGDVAAGAGTVVDHQPLAEELCGLYADDARHHVARPARGEAEHEGYRPRWIVGCDRRRHRAERRREAGGEDDRSGHRYLLAHRYGRTAGVSIFIPRARHIR